MNINNVSAGNVPAAGQITGEAQAAQVKSAGSEEAAQQAAAPKAADEPAAKVELGQAELPVNDEQKAAAAKIETKQTENLLQSVLKEIGTAIDERSAIIKSLPADIQDVTQEILSKTLADSATIAEGMISTIKAEKSAVEQLQAFTSLLADAEQISRQVPEKMLQSLADLLQNFETDFTNVLQKAAGSEQAEVKNNINSYAKIAVAQEKLPESTGEMPSTSEARGTPGNGVYGQRALPTEEAAAQHTTTKQLDKTELSSNQPAEKVSVNGVNDKANLQGTDKTINNFQTATEQQPGMDSAALESGKLPSGQQAAGAAADKIPPKASGQRSVSAGEIEQQAFASSASEKVGQQQPGTDAAALESGKLPAGQQAAGAAADKIPPEASGQRSVSASEIEQQAFASSASEKVGQQQPGTDAAAIRSGNLPAEDAAKTQLQKSGGQTSAPANEMEQPAANSEIMITPQQVGKNSASNEGVINDQSKQAEVNQDNMQQPQSSAAGENTASVGGSQAAKQSLEDIVMNLAKQLAGNSMASQGVVKNDIKQFFQQSPLQQTDNSQEAAILKQTVENFTQNAPEILKFAAGKHNLPELPQLWALVKLHKTLEWTKFDQEKLQQTIRSMREMTASMKKSVAFSGEKIDNNSTLSFSMPLYLGEGMQPYPAYIHLYQQRQKDGKNGGEYTYETWLRICLSTENIGPVDIVFRLYQKNLLNVKVAFTEEATVQSFNSYLPDMREAIDESALNLVEVSVNTKADLGG
ncbi:MAG: flagellar hook-length control protein FliK [Pelosinus sp.]|nr:flagellar hook-length control protein FliK [Pelosinus sp.]